MAAQWQVRIGQDIHGPYTSRELKQYAAEGRIPRDAQVRQGDQGAWYPAAKVRGLFDSGGEHQGGQQAATPTQPQTSQPYQPTPNSQQAYPTQPAPQMQPMQPAPQTQPASQMQQTHPVAHMPTTPGFGAQTPMTAPGGFGGHGYGGGGEPARWKKVSIGTLILAIAMCVFAGASVLALVAEGLLEISLIMAIAGPEPPSRPDFRPSRDRSGFQQEMQNYQEEVREYREKIRDRAETIGGFRDAGEVFYKIARIIFLLAAIACVVGYVFGCFAPNRKGLMGLAIAAISLAGVNLIMQLIFKTIPTFDDEKIYDHVIFGVGAGRFADTGDTVLAMFIDLGCVAELIVFAIFLIMLGKVKGVRNLSTLGMFSLYLFAGFGGALLVVYIWSFIDFDYSDRWPLYVSWVLHWLGNVALGIGLFFYIKGLFSAKSVLSGGRKPGGYGATY